MDLHLNPDDVADVMHQMELQEARHASLNPENFGRESEDLRNAMRESLDEHLERSKESNSYADDLYNAMRMSESEVKPLMPYSHFVDMINKIGLTNGYRLASVTDPQSLHAAHELRLTPQEYLENLKQFMVLDDGFMNNMPELMCEVCGELTSRLCSGCNKQWYCCEEHQRYDWHAHFHRTNGACGGDCDCSASELQAWNN